MASLTVRLKARSYPIRIETGLLDRVGPLLAEAGFSRNVAVITHPKIRELLGARLLTSLRRARLRPLVLEVPAGERSKSLTQVQRLYDALLAARFDRGCVLVAFGGGVVGDLTGFVAATYLRGVAYVQAPTTLLAQVDSRVGGKTAVNHPLGKNLIGAFYQPRAVYIDPETLHSLPAREYRCGVSEVVKCGFIADAGLLRHLETHPEEVRRKSAELLERLIHTSCAIKARLVSRDEEDRSGLRAILNYGHTLAHAIEAVSDFRRFRHGEAVAVGMVCAARLSEEVLGCPGNLRQRTVELLGALGLPTRCSGLDQRRLLEAMALDKKVLDGKLRFVLLKRLGRPQLAAGIPTAQVRWAIPV